MNKNLFIGFFCLISLLLTVAANISFAEMQTESLTIDPSNSENGENVYSQTFQNKEIPAPKNVQEQQTNTKEVIMVPVNNYYYSPYYYPNPMNYTRRIGPYGVYSNWGIGGYDYKGFAFDYSNGFKNKAIYVTPPAPPPPPPAHYHPPVPPMHGPKPPPNHYPNRPKPNHPRPY